ncbi:MAG: ABC transporter ATP-binding protein [Anaerolineae bacterium]|nr:ABC transporter ATP-binding protein [Anaerolineae bacterium]MDW8098745.1 ABC transporter ATP-binding protein [Anaerolineae bacterium]
MQASGPASVLLQIEQLSKAFHGLQALVRYHLRLQTGELLGIIGPNGAGKTTLFNLITGVLKPTSGRILFNGRDITGLSPAAICRAGIARTFQNVRLFGSVSVLENVRISLQLHARVHPIEALLSLPGFYRHERLLTEQARELLHLFGLEAYQDLAAKHLPYGLQRKLEMACALASRPRLLLLDEPAAGMNPKETEDLMALIREVHDRFGLTIILIEHNMRVVMAICERIQALNYGEIIAEGTPEQIQSHPAVIEAYLGQRELTMARSR